MRRQVVDAIAPPLYAAVDFLVILAPALTVKMASDRGGMGDTNGLDLWWPAPSSARFMPSSPARGSGRKERTVVRRPDIWIAAVDALVVFTVAATILPPVVPWGFADEHASLADRGYPVVALWLGVQLVAVGWPRRRVEWCSGGWSRTPAVGSACEAI